MRILILLSFFTFSVFAEVPDYMVGAEITARTRDGKTYTFKGEEYKVVRRTSLLFDLPSDKPSTPLIVKTEKPRNIMSLGVINSHSGGLNVRKEGDSHIVSTERRIGLSLDYKRLISSELYMGMSVDTNRGVGVNMGGAW